MVIIEIKLYLSENGLIGSIILERFIKRIAGIMFGLINISKLNCMILTNPCPNLLILANKLLQHHLILPNQPPLPLLLLDPPLPQLNLLQQINFFLQHLID
jgi:hypothetical protein